MEHILKSGSNLAIRRISLVGLFMIFILKIPNTETDERRHDWCLEPLPPLRVIEAFNFNPALKNSLSENNFVPTNGQANWYRENTTIFVGCSHGYTAISTGHVKITCISDGTSQQAYWNGTFPNCARNICWWHRPEEDTEIFYKKQRLYDLAAGFPEGSNLHFVNWTCTDGKVATNNSLTCLSNGTWAGHYPTCTEPERNSCQSNEHEEKVSFSYKGKLMVDRFDSTPNEITLYYLMNSTCSDGTVIPHTNLTCLLNQTWSDDRTGCLTTCIKSSSTNQSAWLLGIAVISTIASLVMLVYIFLKKKKPDNSSPEQTTNYSDHHDTTELLSRIPPNSPRSDNEFVFSEFSTHEPSDEIQ